MTSHINHIHPSRWMTIDNTTIEYPTNGVGGGSTTAADTQLTKASIVALDGILVTASFGGGSAAFTIYAADGVTVRHTITIASGQATPLYVPLGGPGGLRLDTTGQTNAGFGAKTGNVALTGELYYRVIA